MGSGWESLTQSIGFSDNVRYQILNLVGIRQVGAERILRMTRIVEHRSALPFGTVVEVHVHRGPVADTPILATVNVTKFSSRPDPDSFVDPLPVADAFLQALAYAERAGIACVWIDDPDGHFPPEKRPMHDVTSLWHRALPCIASYPGVRGGMRARLANEDAQVRQPVNSDPLLGAWLSGGRAFSLALARLGAELA
jgi:hypothetical protein